MSGVQDPRAARTRARLRAALLEACAEQPLSDVSVAEVVQRAGIGRATFYLHYPALEELAVDACADVVRDAVEALHAWRGIPDPATPPPPLEEFFSSLEQHRAVYTALMTPGGGGPLGSVLHRDLRERSRRERELAGAPEAELVAAAVAGTFAGVLADWLHGLVPGTATEVAGRVWRLLISLHRTPLG
ncbi:transcriptional regulator, TetR family [Catenulispora acidiphila DSM 44928]|uniref:Transcriptional regulator, TetR family n=1 Tax=Catenulispora acidiphila (strain DSM 44928 / JCM 14897 / NBRC 102108 / NRRL B-24433 / ID139908) TaxID=479433 RepID=C7Q0K5_CATAD|nr:TetR/AcrR family transcriptional regulator [Catenulispora acidiphila]ACU69633.1 transcriptional regulator, TetR family [Catenulispora acidiphila DSM 44928]